MSVPYVNAVDEIELNFKDTVVESFCVDAQSSLLLEYLGQGLSQIGHLKPLSVGVTPSNTTTMFIIGNNNIKVSKVCKNNLSCKKFN